MSMFLTNRKTVRFDPLKKTTKSRIGGIIIAIVLEATAPTSEMNKSMRGTKMANANVNNTNTVRNACSTMSSLVVLNLLVLFVGSMSFFINFNGRASFSVVVVAVVTVVIVALLFK